MTRPGAKRLACLMLVPPLLLGVAPPSKPLHIMTLTLCDDMLALMMVPRDRIASVTYLAHDAARLLLPAGADAGVAINHGTAEEIVEQRPDLIVGAPFSATTARRLARQAGARLVELDDAESFDGIRRRVRAFGAAVGEPARAALLIRRMDGLLRALAATRPARPWRVVAWGGGGTVPGKGTLADAIITAAGAENIAAAPGAGRATGFDLERLLAARPDAVLQEVTGSAPPSLHQGSARHPLIDRAFAGRQIDYPEIAFTCGLPQSAVAAARLRARLERIAPSPARG